MNHHRLSILAGCLIAFGLMLTGCAANLFTYEGKPVGGTHLITLNQASGQGAWHSKDVTVDYEFSIDGNRLSIAGTARLSNHLIYSFSSIKRFALQLNIADSARIVLTTAGLVTLAQRDSEDPISFKQVVDLPLSASYLAFSYRGSMYDSGTDLSGATWDFWQRP